MMSWSWNLWRNLRKSDSLTAGVKTLSPCTRRLSSTCSSVSPVENDFVVIIKSYRKRQSYRTFIRKVKSPQKSCSSEMLFMIFSLRICAKQQVFLKRSRRKRLTLEEICELPLKVRKLPYFFDVAPLWGREDNKKLQCPKSITGEELLYKPPRVGVADQKEDY